MEKEFPTASVLSVTTGRLLVRDIGKFYEILNFITQDNLFTHQLVRASKFAAPLLIIQHPELKDISEDEINETNWEEWLAEKIKLFGDTLTITSSEHLWKSMDPITEFIQMKSKEK